MNIDLRNGRAPKKTIPCKTEGLNETFELEDQSNANADTGSKVYEDVNKTIHKFNNPITHPLFKAKQRN